MKKKDEKTTKKRTYKYHIKMIVENQFCIGRKVCRNKDECMAVAADCYGRGGHPDDLGDSENFREASNTQVEVTDESGKVVLSTCLDDESIKNLGIKVCQEDRCWADLSDSKKTHLFAWLTEMGWEYFDDFEMELPFDPQRLTIHKQEFPNGEGDYISEIVFIDYNDGNRNFRFPYDLEGSSGFYDFGTLCYMVRNGRWEHISEEMVTDWEEKA